MDHRKINEWYYDIDYYINSVHIKHYFKPFDDRHHISLLKQHSHIIIAVMFLSQKIQSVQNEK